MFQKGRASLIPYVHKKVPIRLSFSYYFNISDHLDLDDHNFSFSLGANYAHLNTNQGFRDQVFWGLCPQPEAWCAAVHRVAKSRTQLND